MLKIVGFQKSDFTTKEGTEIKGYNLYFAEKINKNGVGLATYHEYLSENKLAQMNLDLEKAVNHNCVISYNKWGKAQMINLVD